MSITKVKKKNEKSYATKWDEAISDAKRKIRNLSDSIAYYRKQKKAGETWPKDPATHN